MPGIDDAPGMTMEELTSSCELYLSAAQMELFRTLSLSANDASAFPENSFARNYIAWEISFRNSIAKLRAARLNVDPSAFLHADGSYDTEADRGAREAFNAENPLEREKLLDRARWNKIDELVFGNLFNFNALCAYKLKLEIQLKWNARSAERSAENLDLAASEVRKEKKAV